MAIALFRIGPLGDDHHVEPRRPQRARGVGDWNPARLAVEVLDHHLAHRRRAGLEALEQRADGAVAQIGEELRLPVVERALRKRRIEQGVLHGVGNRSHRVHHRRAECLDRRHGLCAVGQRSAVRGQHADELCTGAIGRRQQAGGQHHLVRERCAGLPEELQHVGAFLQRVRDQAARDDWSDLMKIEFE